MKRIVEYETVWGASARTVDIGVKDLLSKGWLLRRFSIKNIYFIPPVKIMHIVFVYQRAKEWIYGWIF